MAWLIGLVFVVLAAAITETYGQTGLTAAQKQQFVDAHNALRKSVKPAATNMKTMIWNNELATIAQNYANKCIWAHNPSRISKTFSYVGENIYITTGTVTNYRSVVQDWYNEVANYHYSTNTCDSGKVCGHYTQVVWATSNSLGCGVKRCAKLTNLPSFKNALMVVCDYGPGGNYVGQKPYASAGYAARAMSLEPEMVESYDEEKSDETELREELGGDDE
eukprot:Em0007g1518a